MRSKRNPRFTSNPDITLFLIRSCKTTIFQKSFFNRTSSIWNALAADLALFCFCSLSSLKTALYGNYKQALVASYNPDDPRSFKSICLTCNAAHNLGRNITCCFQIVLQFLIFFSDQYLGPAVIGVRYCCVPACTPVNICTFFFFFFFFFFMQGHSSYCLAKLVKKKLGCLSMHKSNFISQLPPFFRI